MASGRTIRTAFLKEPMDGPVRVGRLGVEGDEHVYVKHGGPDMALLVYSHDHYAYWRSVGLDLPPSGAFGENLTVTGLTEVDVHIGDVFRVGDRAAEESGSGAFGLVVQVTQPRTPCSTIAARYGMADLAAHVQRTGFTGYLLRVLHEGWVAAGDAVHLVERSPHGITVADAGRVLNVDRNDHAGARRLLEIEALAASVRRTLEDRLAEGQQLGLDLDGCADDD